MKLQADVICSICYKIIEKGHPTSSLDCQHCFHSDCIEGWGEESGSECPTCEVEKKEREKQKLYEEIERVRHQNMQLMKRIMHQQIQEQIQNYKNYFGI